MQPLNKGHFVIRSTTVPCTEVVLIFEREGPLSDVLLYKIFFSLMSGLNFLRYLLIRDRMEVNRVSYSLTSCTYQWLPIP